jgi:hypothetical protein
MARTALPWQVLSIILVHTWILLPPGHMDSQERPIVGFGNSKDFVQGSLGAYFDGQIRSFSAHVGSQPLHSEIINICPDTYAVCREVYYVLHSTV